MIGLEFSLEPIQRHRDFYAKFIVGIEGSSNERLIAAFSRVERERFLPPGPWHVQVGKNYVPTISSDPRLVYQDMLIGLDISRRINNGQPSLHACCISACDPQRGESVVHVGAGMGYYTAVLTEMVGDQPPVIAYEIDENLAAAARNNLAHLENVTVRNASGANNNFPQADIVYVSAGATHPLDVWLDALSIGGRLLFPLTAGHGFGCMLLITRVAPESYAARIIVRAGFIPCIGARDEELAQALSRALDTNALREVRSLRRIGQPNPP